MNLIKYIFFSIIGMKNKRPQLSKNECRTIHSAYRKKGEKLWKCNKCSHTWKYLSPLRMLQ